MTNDRKDSAIVVCSYFIAFLSGPVGTVYFVRLAKILCNNAPLSVTTVLRFNIVIIRPETLLLLLLLS